MTTAIALLVAIAAIWTALFVMAASWVYRDAKEAAETRRHEAEMAALGARTHKAHQDHGRYTTSDERRPE